MCVFCFFFVCFHRRRLSSFFFLLLLLYPGSSFAILPFLLLPAAFSVCFLTRVSAFSSLFFNNQNAWGVVHNIAFPKQD